MENSEFFGCIRNILHGIEAYHDSHTMQHEYRTGKLMAILARAIGLDEKYCESLEAVGSIHDIGKVALPAYILEKPGALSAFERQTIELHPKIGYELIKKIKNPLGELAAIVSLTHHESYDGSGYPNGLKADNIPLEGRICRICDVYDALRSYRPYRTNQGMDLHQFSIKLMTNKSPDGMANKFDPDLLQLFQKIHAKYQHIYVSPLSST